jgi:hypothetical protein
MSAIWDHVESVVNQPNPSPSPVLNTRSPLEIRRTECVEAVGAYGPRRLAVANETKAVRIASRNDRETGDVGGTACHRTDQQLSL